MTKPPPLELTGTVPPEDQFAPGVDDYCQDRIDELEAALHSIQQWAEAYPLSIFPEPDMTRANELLEAGGISLAAVSASMARHIVSGIGTIAREALK